MSNSCYIDPDNLEPGSLQRLWDKQVQDNGWGENHHNWIRKVRAKLNQETTYTLPDSFNDKNTDGLTVTLPQTVVTSLRTVSMLERRRPKVKRKPQSGGITHREKSIASDVTTWLNAVLESEQQGRKIFDWGKLIGKLFLEGAAAVVAIPNPADFEKCPDYIDTIDARRYERLSPSRRANYRQGDDGRYERIDEDGMPSPHSRYWRDASGRAADDSFYKKPLERDGKHGKKGSFPMFKEDRAQTKKAYAEMREHFLASRLPFRVRVLSPTDAIPIFGPGEQLYGLIERSEYTEEDLVRRKYVLGPPLKADEEKEDGQPALTQGIEGKGTVVLFSYWGYTKKNEPFVAFEAEGRAYTRFGDEEDSEDEQAPAVINLAEELDIERLPVRWCWGLHLETEEASKKGVPFLRPVLDIITMAERFLAMKAVHADQHAFPSYVIEPDPELLRTNPGIFFHSDGTPRIIPLTPMHMVVAPGKITPLVTPFVGNDVNDLIKILMGAANSMGPSGAAFGGEGATSGFDRALTKEYLETSMWQVMAGGLEGYGWAGSFVLEHGARLAEYYDLDLPVYAAVENKQANVKADDTEEPIQQIVRLNPDWVGPIYDVTPYYDREFGENFALAQQMSQDVKDGLATFEEYREKVYGDQYPHITRIKIWFDQWLRTDEGRGRIAELAGEMIGTGLEDELKALIESNEMTDDGIPIDALPDGWRGQINMEMAPPGMGEPQPISPLPPGAPGPVGPAPGPGESGPQRIGTLPPTLIQSAAGGIQSGATMARPLGNVAEATQGIQPF